MMPNIVVRIETVKVGCNYNMETTTEAFFKDSNN